MELDIINTPSVNRSDSGRSKTLNPTGPWKERKNGKDERYVEMKTFNIKLKKK